MILLDMILLDICRRIARGFLYHIQGRVEMEARIGKCGVGFAIGGKSAGSLSFSSAVPQKRVHTTMVLHFHPKFNRK